MPRPKEFLINIASIYVFLTTILVIVYQEHWKKIILGLAATFLVAYVYPPLGWKRPHRHSDMASNRVDKD